ncbi:uncharacterized protein LOC129883612 [Solanum dulcamara]|uniref:uncharacterized protein LOC129883612 n=1 Tax=Solanum dulcamara TaxID=45834 RepID=UPI002484EB9E|nr:uncharacterized protein LOC129883612 [Solanum dulcamara]
MRKHEGFMKRGNTSRDANGTDLCHGCRKSGHFIRDCPMQKGEYRNYDKRAATDYVVKRALVVWRNSSSDSEESDHPENTSMMDVKDDDEMFNSMFAFMEKPDDEADKEGIWESFICGAIDALPPDQFE